MIDGMEYLCGEYGMVLVVRGFSALTVLACVLGGVRWLRRTY